MSEDPMTVLVIADGPLPAEASSWVDGRHALRRIFLLPAGAAGDAGACPSHWEKLAPGDLLDNDALRRDFLAFLEDWPCRPLDGGASFEQRFRHRDGWSLWWTGPGAQRHPVRGPFPALRVLWLAARALDRLRPGAVVIFTRDARLAVCLASQAVAAQVPADFAPGSARPGEAPWSGRTGWLVRSLGWMAKFLLLGLARAVLVRRITRKAPGPAQRADSPAVVMTALFPQHTDCGERGGTVWYWAPLARLLNAPPRPIRARYLFHVEWRYLLRAGWVNALFRLLGRARRLPGALALPDTYLDGRSWMRHVGRQLRLLLRYWRFETGPEFRQSFRFCGADVAPLYVPLLREAVARALYWEHGVDAAAAVLRSAGAVRAVLVHEEFYAHAGMIVIAACRRLGVPSVGVQHGTIYPMHLIYTLPAGQVAAAPTPDYFAAYSEFAREVVSVHGHYPAERVWVCGGPRFDPLITDPPDPAECRRRRNLPAGRFVLLVTTQGQEWFPAAVRALVDAARDLPDVCLCIKCWNGDAHRDLYNRMAEEGRPADVRVFTDHFADLLGACDALASASSTTLLEATLLAKPTVCLNFSAEPERYPYVEEGVSLAARTPEEVRRAVYALIRFAPTAAWDERRRHFLVRHLGPTASGRAADAFAALLRERLLDRPAPGRARRAA